MQTSANVWKKHSLLHLLSMKEKKIFQRPSLPDAFPAPMGRMPIPV
jgi:hypothetical protein